MARITVDDCLKRINNRFHVTLAATYRARQLSAGASPMVEPNRDKPTVIALREIAAGKVGTEVLKKNPTYFKKGRPFLDQLTFKSIGGDEAARLPEVWKLVSW